MRHGDKINNLGRTASHRRALLSNLASNLIEHKRITTTLAKAKALRRYIEPLVTKAKDNTTHSRRVVFSYLQNKDSITELFGPIAEKIADRPGGYLRIIKLGFRRGDGAETAMIEFVDYNEVYNPKAGKDSGSARKTRRGSRRKSSATPPAPKAAAPAEVVEDVVEDAVEAAPVETVVEAVAEAPVVEEAVEAATEVVEDAVAETTEEAPAQDESAGEEEENKEA
ncbi:MAG: 50S ribosomal protein L17 [Lewinellaceae bacterium]|nr:50S ribosomal protein L17 [Lewinellaceae bacterium]